MALRGTLKDFGIADIFQLISHQSKTGVLHLQTKDREVRIFFDHGDVVRAESTTRRKKDRLGAMFLRSEIITDDQLDHALEIQERTLKRLGDVLVEQGYINRGELKEFMRLQTTETVYRLFHWEAGTYAFESEEVAYDKETFEPIRSENILMEGFRMVDEWPMIRKKISSYEMTFLPLKGLSAQGKPRRQADEIDDALDGMFDQARQEEDKPKHIGRNEQKVFALVAEERDVQKLIDLSRLGEFETCKALYNLINEGYLKAVVRREAPKVDKDKPGGLRRFPVGRVLIQASMYVFLAGLFLILYRVLELDAFSLIHERGTRTFQDPVARELIDRSQVRRLRAALEVYRMETGRYPNKLSDLVEASLVSRSDTRFPWRRDRFYEARDDGFVILRPFE